MFGIRRSLWKGSLWVDSLLLIKTRTILPNARYVIMWNSQAWREMNLKSYKTTRRHPRFYLQSIVSILPWLVNMTYWEWKKQQMTYHVSFHLWLLEVRKCLLKNMCGWQGRELLMQSTTHLSWWLWHGDREIHMCFYLNEESMKGIDVDD